MTLNRISCLSDFSHYDSHLVNLVNIVLYSMLLSFTDNAPVCLCQSDRCVVIIHRQCCRMFVSER